MRSVIIAAMLLAAGCLDAPGPSTTPVEDDPAMEVAQGPGTAAESAADPALFESTFQRALHAPSGPAAVVLVVHAARGYEPLEQALDLVAEELARALQKPVTWQRQVLEVEGDADRRWPGPELGVMARALRAQAWPDDTVLLHAVSLPGCYQTGSRDCVGGVEIGTAAFVFFDEKRDVMLAGETRDIPYVGERSVQRYILLHELGHAMGLVDSGVPAIDTSRVSDDACACHSTTEHSVMRGQGGTNISGDPGHDLEEIEDLLNDERWNHRFDEADIADLRAFQAALG